MPPQNRAATAPARHDMSVILVTGSYDHDIRFWEAWSGICSRTIARTGENGVRLPFSLQVCVNLVAHALRSNSHIASQPSGDISGVRDYKLRI